LTPISPCSLPSHIRVTVCDLEHEVDDAKNIDLSLEANVIEYKELACGSKNCFKYSLLQIIQNILINMQFNINKILGEIEKELTKKLSLCLLH